MRRVLNGNSNPLRIQAGFQSRYGVRLGGNPINPHQQPGDHQTDRLHAKGWKPRRPHDFQVGRAVRPSRPPAPGSAFTGPGIEDPQFGARLGVESHHTRIYGRQVLDVADHDRRCLEWTGPGTVGAEWLLVGLPLPGDLEITHIGGRDRLRRRVLGLLLLDADVRPFKHGARFLGTRKGDEQENGSRQRQLQGEKPYCRPSPVFAVHSSCGSRCMP